MTTTPPGIPMTTGLMSLMDSCCVHCSRAIYTPHAPHCPVAVKLDGVGGLDFDFVKPTQCIRPRIDHVTPSETWHTPPPMPMPMPPPMPPEPPARRPLSVEWAHWPQWKVNALLLIVDTLSRAP